MKTTQSYDAAIHEYEQVLQLDPGYLWAHLNMADCLRALGKHGEALEHNQKAVEMDPGEGCGHTKLRLPHTAPGITLSSRMPCRFSDLLIAGNMLALFGVGVGYLEHKRVPEAVEHLQRGLALDPNHVASYLKLAEAFRTLGMHDGAVQALESALSIDENHADAHHRLALELDDKGQKQQARRHYLRAIKLDPKLRDTHLNLAVLLEAEGDIAEAKVHLDHVMRMDPNNAQVHHLLGVMADNEGHLDDAAAHYSKAVKVSQVQSPALLYNAALLSQDMGNTIDYVRYLQMLVHADSSFADVKERLAAHTTSHLA